MHFRGPPCRASKQLTVKDCPPLVALARLKLAPLQLFVSIFKLLVFHFHRQFTFEVNHTQRSRSLLCIPFHRLTSALPLSSAHVAPQHRSQSVLTFKLCTRPTRDSISAGETKKSALLSAHNIYCHPGPDNYLSSVLPSVAAIHSVARV